MKNKELRASYYDKRCAACGRRPSDPAHIKTYATTLEDSPDNIIPLCREHHTESHKIGMATFCVKYPQVREVVYRMGWDVVTIFGTKKIRKREA